MIWCRPPCIHYLVGEIIPKPSARSVRRISILSNESRRIYFKSIDTLLAEDLTSNHNSLKTHNCFRFLNIDDRRKSTAKLKNCRIRSYCAFTKKENRQEKKDNLYFISKYLYTSGQIVVPALARKSLLAATSHACSPSQRPTIWALTCVSCSWHGTLEGILGCTQIFEFLRPYIVPTIANSSKGLGHWTYAFCPSHTIVFSLYRKRDEITVNEPFTP